MDFFTDSGAPESQTGEDPGQVGGVPASDGSKKSKTPRPLACTQCRARKRKCNKIIPCNECRKRGVAHLCTADLRKEPPSYGKITGELSQLRARLAHLEEFLSQKHAEFEPGVDLSGAVEESFPYDDVGGTDGELLQFAQSYSQSETLAPVPYASAVPISVLATSTDTNPADQLLSDHSMAFAETLATFRDFDIFPTEHDPHVPSNALAGAEVTTNSLYPTVTQTSRLLHTIPWAQNLVAYLITVLPPLNMCRGLVQLYFDYASRMIYSVNRQQFMHELQEFEILMQNGRASTVDPAWLALLFIVLSGTMYGGTQLNAVYRCCHSA